MRSKVLSQENVQNGSHSKIISQNDQNSNQHIVGPYVQMHTTCEVSMVISMGSRANERKSKWLLFENYMSE